MTDEPEAFAFNVGDPVSKLSGYAFDGFIRSAFHNDDGFARYVVEHAAIKGMLHIFSRKQLAARTSSTGASAREIEQFAIGTPVRCQIDNMKADWRHEWKDWTGFIARIDYCSQNGVNYTVSDEWPPRYLTDGFAPNELATLDHIGHVDGMEG